MKKPTWDTPNKMHFESAHKTFNRQTICISTGNVWSTTQHSGYIRPYDEVECNGLTFPPGQLLDFDLRPFRDYGIDDRIIKQVKKLVNERTCQSTILYLFKHYTRDKDYWRGEGWRRINDGLVLTSGGSDGYRLIHVWYLNPDWRAQNAVNEATLYITNSIEEGTASA